MLLELLNLGVSVLYVPFILLFLLADSGNPSSSGKVVIFTGMSAFLAPIIASILSLVTGHKLWLFLDILPLAIILLVLGTNTKLANNEKNEFMPTIRNKLRSTLLYKKMRVYLE